jgi:hypothetical protein
MNSVITTELTDFRAIPNAYEVDANSDLFLTKGYAIGFGPAVNGDSAAGEFCKMTVIRTISVVLTSQVTALLTDFDGVNTVAKQLFEDQYKIIKAIERDPSLNGSSQTRFVGDGGLEFVTAGQDKYFLIELQFDCRYSETL